MKTLRTIALLTVLASMLFAVGAQAQQPTVGVYFGPNKMPWKTASPNQAFDIWVVAKNINGTIDAIEYKITLPVQLIVTNYGYYDGSIRVGSAATGYGIGFPDCLQVLGDNELVVQHMTGYVYSTFPQFDVTLTQYEGAAGAGATSPRYSDCNGNVVDLQVENGILIGTTVEAESQSFGAVKALY